MTLNEFLQIKDKFENNQDKSQPYLIKFSFEKVYNPYYKSEVDCRCGHSYDRHFDPYKNNEAVGCKYCGCSEFISETRNKFDILTDYLSRNLADYIVENNRILVTTNLRDKERIGDIVDVTDWDFDKLQLYFVNYDIMFNNE